ncbi:hypothetical protein C9374_008777 [Naegleria lovaniensis]|uniref:Uncharacterized protein n=1 Tax=Naegleria lovaniensis TaxID=51637 RepID=A0AA88GJX3_NAELO|nr:uncharacterized protein C9374_008777 [Naegleria lovaniensis]KAG2378155.1 hypothetical protein C9374_008777 [Naegleria lovaniensis]
MKQNTFENSEWNSLTRLELLDFFSNSSIASSTSPPIEIQPFTHLELFSKFRDKMRRGKTPILPFSITTFKLVNTIKKFSVRSELNIFKCNDQSRMFDGIADVKDSEKEYTMDAPVGIKISHHHQCIIVSDYNNQNTIIVDLENCKSLKKILPIQTNAIELDRNYNGLHQDALLCFRKSCVMKYDLNQLLTESFESVTPLWTSTKCSALVGMTIVGQEVLVTGDNNRVYVLSLLNGELLQTMTLPDTILRATGIDALSHNEVVLGEGYPFDRLILCRKIDNTWKFVKILVEESVERENETPYPYHLVIDRATRNIIVSSCYGLELRIFSPDGQKRRTYGKDLLSYPEGMCINELTGELFVCDTDHCSIHIFK